MSGYEVIVQVRQGAIERILNAQHRYGVMAHQRDGQDPYVTWRLVLGYPRLAMEPTPAGGNAIGASITFDAMYSEIGRTSRHVLSEPVRITVHTSTELAGGQNPTPYRAGLELALRWSATAADVSRIGGGGPNSDVVRRILTSMGQWSDAFGVPRVPGATPVTAIAHRVFLDPQTREPILAVGIETDGGGSSLDELSAQSVSSGMDWEVRLSEGFIEALRDSYKGDVMVLRVRLTDTAPEIASLLATVCPVHEFRNRPSACRRCPPLVPQLRDLRCSTRR